MESYYRRGMKIGEIELKDIPEKLKGKFWGYIEVDEAWELELADIEDKVHFGVSKGKRKTTTYQNLKNYCNGKIRTILTEWGFIKDKENPDWQEKNKKMITNLRDCRKILGIDTVVTDDRIPKTGLYTIDKRQMEKWGVPYTTDSIMDELFYSRFVSLGSLPLVTNDGEGAPAL